MCGLKDSNKSDELICIKCPKARFPDPREQCYKFGGLICTLDNSNVGKYERCKWGYTLQQLQKD
ncbi:hypothetical protein J7K19_11210 [bacterium]|nr:hypothetical protein [bacterium]